MKAEDFLYSKGISTDQTLPNNYYQLSILLDEYFDIRVNESISEDDINASAECHNKPIDGNEWTHNNSFKEGVRWSINKILGKEDIFYT